LGGDLRSWKIGENLSFTFLNSKALAEERRKKNPGEQDHCSRKKKGAMYILHGERGNGPGFLLFPTGSRNFLVKGKEKGERKYVLRGPKRGAFNARKALRKRKASPPGKGAPCSSLQ